MTEISAEMVKELRDATNVSMMECKRALTEAGGDMAKATKVLRERGMAVAAKKASRTANQGLIASSITGDGRTGSLVEVNCETDFVARNPDFQTFVAELAKKACATDGNLADEVKSDVSAKVAAIGENIVVRRNIRYTLDGAGKIASYIHLGGKVGTLIEVGCTKAETVKNEAFEELAKDLTLQIAASSPKWLTSKEIPSDVIASEREIYAKQVTGKPANIVDKIVDGKLKKFYSDVCLMDQLFVKEQKQSITQLLEAKGKQISDTITIKRFVRYQVGV
jgi:elongation factor Ts